MIKLQINSLNDNGVNPCADLLAHPWQNSEYQHQISAIDSLKNMNRICQNRQLWGMSSPAPTPLIYTVVTSNNGPQHGPPCMLPLTTPRSRLNIVCQGWISLFIWQLQNILGVTPCPPNNTRFYSSRYYFVKKVATLSTVDTLLQQPESVTLAYLPLRCCGHYWLQWKK